MTAQSFKKLSARKLELLEHVLEQENLKTVDSEAISPLQERGGVVAMSYAQQRMWFMEEMDGGKGLYNLRAGVRMRGKLEVEVLGRVVREVVKRHEVLRTRFGMKEGKGVQIIEGEGKVELEVVELKGGSREEKEEELRREMKEEGERGFDVEQGPLLRAKLWKVVDEELAVVPAADSFLRQLRFGRDGAESTTRAYAGGIALFLRWCARTGRGWEDGIGQLGLFM